MLMAGDDTVVRFARNSARMLLSVMMARCSFGLLDDVSGSADEKFHSSSSAGAATAGCLPVVDCDMKDAKGSEAGGAGEGGAATADAPGRGVVDCDADGEANDMNWLLSLLVLLLPEFAALL